MIEEQYYQAVEIRSTKANELIKNDPRTSKYIELLSNEIFEGISNCVPVFISDIKLEKLVGIGFSADTKKTTAADWYNDETTEYYTMSQFHLNLFIDVLISLLWPGLSYQETLKKKTEVAYLQHTDYRGTEGQAYYFSLFFLERNQ